ncbi:tyrosinase [Peniophora sp. CONT]|nr:tyrosinase [Peniophora sp. CONT]
MFASELADHRPRRTVSSTTKALSVAAIACACSSMLIAANAVVLPCRGPACDSTFSSSTSVARQNAQHVLTTGVTTGTQNRLEINAFIQNNEQWSLFVQALASIQEDDQSDPKSYYQVAGIYGQPFVRYDGSGDTRPPPNAWPGYSFHRSILFPTWHRLHVALFEQTLQERAVQIAANYTDPVFQSAAQALRLPFWDWASNSVPPHQVISDAQVNFVAANGSILTMANPLVSYRFHPVDGEFEGPFNTDQSTVRHPTGFGTGARSNIVALQEQLASSQDDITSKTFNMLARVKTWPAFSNSASGDGNSTSNSLEALNDAIQLDVGGRAGHMSNPTVAAFDPIFWLHLANIDRLISLWEALHPDVLVSQGQSGAGSWTLPRDVQVDSSTELMPFRETDSTFWDSSQIMSTEKLGYSYPDFDGLDLANPDTVRLSVALQVSELYGPVRNASANSTGQANATSQQGDSSQPSYDWTVRVQSSVDALNGSYAVLLFVGPIPEDAAEFRDSHSFVGSHSVWTSAVMPGSDNVESFVHLNGALSQRAGISSTDPEAVAPFLTQNIGWRVVKDDELVGAEQVPSLNILAIATRMTLDANAALPDYGEPQSYPDITAGQLGGQSSSE